MRAARTCYDHLAGTLGVRIADSLVQNNHIELSDEAGAVTDPGIAFFAEFGIDPVRAGSRSGKRVFCRPCLDWSERVPHVGGTLGAALATPLLRAGLDRAGRRQPRRIGNAGRKAGFRRRFGIAL